MPAAWREGDNAVYEMPWKGAGLAHVVERAALVTRAPANGVDIAPLDRLARALDAAEPGGRPSAAFRWINAHEAAIDAQVGPGQAIFVQVNYDRGWRALENGAERRIVPDALGLMAIEPVHLGPCHLRLAYAGGEEATVARGAQLAGIGLLLVWTAVARWRARQTAR